MSKKHNASAPFEPKVVDALGQKMYLVNKETGANIPLKSIFFEADVFASRLATVQMV